MTLAELLPAIKHNQRVKLILIDARTEEPIERIFFGEKISLETNRDLLKQYRKHKVFGTFTSAGVITFELKEGDPE